MRYRLRTLLILLAIAPPLLAITIFFLDAGQAFQDRWHQTRRDCHCGYHPLRAAVFRFTLRDVLWLTVVVGFALCWGTTEYRWRQRDAAEHSRFYRVLGDLMDPAPPTWTQVWGPYIANERPAPWPPAKQLWHWKQHEA